jgi:hypothetical protein
MARAIAATAEPLARGESEFELSGLTPLASVGVRPPRVKESPLSYECRTMQVEEGVLDERGNVRSAVLDTVGRMGGMEYCRTRERFDLPSGRAALRERGG